MIVPIGVTIAPPGKKRVYRAGENIPDDIYNGLTNDKQRKAITEYSAKREKMKKGKVKEIMDQGLNEKPETDKKTDVAGKDTEAKK